MSIPSSEAEAQPDDEPRVVVVGRGPSPGMSAGEREEDDLTAQVEQPAKVMRIGTMIKQLLEEVRAAPLDEAGRRRLADIHQSSIRELEDGLSDDLREELDRLTLPFADNEVPSEAELRIAQAQLVGWLEGLFHGIQTALFAQQMAARAQLEQMRGRALPGQVGPGGGLGSGSLIGQPGLGDPGVEHEHGTGQYL
ncbi:bacterial proteasome activator family protein [Jatrophihabitans telluris]|uniref:bacterial proteasome activator family protein n=1 Tax=Jatrophihabitans telluris TaxID=2038343 RepID=UPI0024BF1168|nr:bacterial proteasome activator family protein [Jatrophihabitans telluris]